jgi:hypothetical protein
MRENLKIVKTDILRDSRLERRIMEYNREAIIYYMVIVGGVMLVLAFVW